MFTYETFPSAHGVGYRLLLDSVAISEQAFKPGVPGFVGMAQEEAEAEAEAEIAARSAA